MSLFVCCCLFVSINGLVERQEADFFIFYYYFLLVGFSLMMCMMKMQAWVQLYLVVRLCFSVSHANVMELSQIT